MKLKSHPILRGVLMRSLFALVILALVLSTFPQEVRAATCKFKHKVQPGETLIYIGNLYQIDWREIAKANGLTEPYVLTVGQILCIPGGTKPEVVTTTTTDSTTQGPYLNVIQGFGHIYIEIKKFPKNSIYYVYIKPESFDVFYRLYDPTLTLKTDKEGKFAGWFHVHEYIPQRLFMILCVKNVMTDAVACVRYENPFYNILYPHWR